ncbi:MAG: hypothetical protein GF346_08245 [Candidatus Eisenbacteria bacterium]|nr:hypothetical protein [Candidatus Latescibacterota bacterium]MBD3302423.1 hypothetical protein [Candidatus Eisenbacteria bacterium]
MKKNNPDPMSSVPSLERALCGIASLADHELLQRIHDLVKRERHVTAWLVAHLAEMDRRRLHLAEGYSSLFTYCTQALHLSEQSAYKRIEAARAARRFPVLLARLGEGDLHLSAVVLLAPLLTKQNHAALIEEARYKTKREVEEIVARVRPAAPVPTLVQRLPASEAPTQAHPAVPPSAPPAPLPPPAPHPRPVVAPLAPERYKVQFTASAEMHERLQRAQELLRHKVPNGDVAQILDLALIALLEKTEARKYGKRRTARSAEDRNGRPERPRPEAKDQPTRSRHIPADVRRAVWERDQGRCTFVSASGIRCAETGCLEFDHREPYACGGPATVENIRLVCRRHNQHYARQRFGSEKVQAREKSPSYAGFTTPLRL